MKKIIVINGTGGCGKDTFIKFCEKYANVYNFSSIDIIKKIATYVGWDGAKDEKSRKFLNELKTIVSDYNDLPFKETAANVEKFQNSSDEVMFIHIREPENIKRTVSAFRAKTLIIKRENYDDITSNSGDANVNNYDYDFVIHNIGIEELEHSAKEFINMLRSTSLDD